MCRRGNRLVLVPICACSQEQNELWGMNRLWISFLLLEQLPLVFLEHEHAGVRSPGEWGRQSRDTKTQKLRSEG